MATRGVVICSFLQTSLRKRTWCSKKWEERAEIELLGRTVESKVLITRWEGWDKVKTARSSNQANCFSKCDPFLFDGWSDICIYADAQKLLKVGESVGLSWCWVKDFHHLGQGAPWYQHFAGGWSGSFRIFGRLRLDEGLTDEVFFFFRPAFFRWVVQNGAEGHFLSRDSR